MRSKSPELMEKISAFVGEHYREKHTTPTVREIAAAIGIGATTAYYYLLEMDRRGMLRYENGRISALPVIDKTETAYVSAPLVGSIRCGNPEQEEAEVEMYVSLPKVIFGSEEMFLLRAEGDSMEDRGISEGDLLLISRTAECRIGDVVVALDENNENTLKVYAGVDRESGRAELRYANEEKYPGKRILVSTLSVQGVARQVIKQLQGGRQWVL